MRQFAKLFDVGDRQLIVYLEYNSEEDDGSYTLHQITDIEYAMLDMSFCGTEDALRKLFDLYDQRMAVSFFETELLRRATGYATEAL